MLFVVILLVLRGDKETVSPLVFPVSFLQVKVVAIPDGSELMYVATAGVLVPSALFAVRAYPLFWV